MKLRILTIHLINCFICNQRTVVQDFIRSVIESEVNITIDELITLSPGRYARPITESGGEVCTIKVEKQYGVCITLEHTSCRSVCSSITLGIRDANLIHVTSKGVAILPIGTNLKWFCNMGLRVGSRTNLSTIHEQSNGVIVSGDCNAGPSILSKDGRARVCNINTVDVITQLTVVKVDSDCHFSCSLTEVKQSCSASDGCRIAVNPCLNGKVFGTECKVAAARNGDISSTVQIETCRSKLLLKSRGDSTISSDRDMKLGSTTSNLTQIQITTSVVSTNNLSSSIFSANDVTRKNQTISRILGIFVSEFIDSYSFTISKIANQRGVVDNIISNLLINLQSTSSILVFNDQVVNLLRVGELTTKLNAGVINVSNLQLSL